MVLFGKTDDDLFSVAPSQDACIVGQFDPGQFLCGGDKFQTTRGYVKEWFGNRAFPQRHTDAIQLTTQFVVFAFDRRQIVDDIKEAACFAGIGIEVAAVLQISCGEELQQVAGGAALGLNKAVDFWVAVVTHAPSGIPRQTEGGQRLAAQKRLKTHLRGNAINFIDVL